MQELARGTQPESESQEMEAASSFSEIERAFFDEGDQLAKKKSITIEEFVSSADRELSFWQRFWRR